MDLLAKSYGKLPWRAMEPRWAGWSLRTTPSKYIPSYVQKVKSSRRLLWMRRHPVTELNPKKQEHRQRKQGQTWPRGTEALHQHLGTELGKSKLRWSWKWKEMWKAILRASTATLIVNAMEDVLNGAGNPLTRGMEKVKILSFFGLHFPCEGLSSALWGPLYYQQSLWEGVTHDQQKRKKETGSTQHTGDTKIYEMRWDSSNGIERSGQCHCKGILPSLRVHGDWGRFSMTRKGKHHHHLYNGHKEDLGNYGTVYLT